jgi:hypothetical protein
MIPNTLTSAGFRRAISTTGDNDIFVYKVDKATNNIVESG